MKDRLNSRSQPSTVYNDSIDWESRSARRLIVEVACGYRWPSFVHFAPVKQQPRQRPARFSFANDCWELRTALTAKSCSASTEIVRLSCGGCVVLSL